MRKYLTVRYSLVTIAVLLLVISLTLSYQNYQTWSTSGATLERKGYDFKNALIGYQDLATDNKYSASSWDNNKFLLVTSEDITNDLATEFDFMIEVHDLSNYSLKYDRTLSNGLAWSSVENPNTGVWEDGNSFKISTFVNIVAAPDEIHLAKIEIIIWE